jgi:hypothetical protein
LTRFATARYDEAMATMITLKRTTKTTAAAGDLWRVR